MVRHAPEAKPAPKASAAGKRVALLVAVVVVGAVVYFRFGAGGGPAPPSSSAPSAGTLTAPAAPAATSVAAAPPAPAPSSSAPSAAAARPLELELEVRAGAPAHRPTVFVVAKELGIDERVAEVPSPFVCRLSPNDRGASVTCTPDVRKVALAISKQGGALELSRPGAEPKRVAIPAGADVVIKRSDKSSRDLPGGECAQGTQARPFEVPFVNHYDAAGGGRLSMLVPNAEKTRVQRVELFRDPGATRCRAEGSEVARHVRCDGVATECDVRIDGASAELECTGPAPASGRVLLPCGSVGRLPTSGVITRIPLE